MAKIKLYLDVRRLMEDGRAAVKISVAHKKNRRFVSTGVSVAPSQWDSAAGKVRPSHPSHLRLNNALSRLLLRAEDAMVSLLSSGEALDFAGLCRAVSEAVHPGEAPSEPSAPSVLETARSLAAAKRGQTRNGYLAMADRLGEFRPDSKFDDVTVSWLREFDGYLASRGMTANGRAAYMRYLRAVFNHALDEGMTANYPFRRYSIKTAATAKRSLTAEEMRLVVTMDVDEWQRQYRDFFALSFFLLGANAKDLAYLPPNADKGGRVEFHRAKTGKLYSIKVWPEAREIIGRMRGERHMLSVMDSRTDHLQYIRQCNHALRTLGTRRRNGCAAEGEPLFPGLTTYYARHSWATIAAELDIPKETIAAALGHDMGNSTTAIYIDYNLAKVDEANRRVIDYVMRGIR